MAKHNKNSAWFKSIRGSYLPNATTGLVIYLIYVAYLVALFGDWYVSGHKLWSLLVNVLPLSAAAALITQYIASRHAK